MMKLSVGYPNIIQEADLLERTRVSHPVDSVKAVTDASTILQMQRTVRDVFVHEKVREYLLRIISRTRDSTHLSLGASPRASMALFHAAQAFSAVAGRSYVIPDDIKQLAFPVLKHRLILNPESRLRRVTPDSVLRGILEEVPVPAGGGWKA